MNSRKRSLDESLNDMGECIRYMEKRISVSPVNKVTDTVLLRLCQAVQTLLEKEIGKDEDNA